LARSIFALASLLAASCAPLPNAVSSVSPSARYVAMGSSYASGPGVTQAADARDPRCTRSNDNYARQVARELKLELVDVSCGGATTKHVREGWNELAPQIDALTADTALVTVTIGGNDLGYVGRLFSASCAGEPTDATKAACAGMRARAGSAPPLPAEPDAASWSATEAGLAAIAAEVRNRSPRARLVFVEYLTVVPDGALCATLPLSPSGAQVARETSKRLARLTEAVAKRTGAEVLRATAMSRGHDACAKEPWVTGFIPAVQGGTFVPYHPNLAGMTAVAEALVAKLR
jgi:lysophospholipase L1-like esterase